jgi:hypothetical protein
MFARLSPPHLGSHRLREIHTAGENPSAAFLGAHKDFQWQSLGQRRGWEGRVGGGSARVCRPGRLQGATRGGQFTCIGADLKDLRIMKEKQSKREIKYTEDVLLSIWQECHLVLYKVRRMTQHRSTSDSHPIRLAYQPPANSTFLSEQTSHQLTILFSQ